MKENSTFTQQSIALALRSSKKNTLGREERLKSRNKIQTLFAKGKVMNFSPFKIIYQFQTDNLEFQLGVAVGTRQFKKAVDRNRIKRLIKEAYRLQKNQLKDLLIIKKTGLSLFIIYSGKTIPDYEFVYEKTGKILQKLESELDAFA